MIDRMNEQSEFLVHGIYIYIYDKTINLKYDIMRNFYLRWKNGRQMELLLAIIYLIKR